MSIARELAVAGQTATAFVEEDSAKNLRTGRLFSVKVDPQGYLAIVGATSKDLREKIKIYTRDRAAALEILPTDELFVIGEKWRVLADSRIDNPAGIHISFECIKIYEEKDTP